MLHPASRGDVTSWLPARVFSAGHNRTLYQLISLRLAGGRPVDPLIIAWDASALVGGGITEQGESLAAAALRLGTLNPAPGTAAVFAQLLYAEQVCRDAFGPNWRKKSRLPRRRAPDPAPAPAPASPRAPRRAGPGSRPPSPAQPGAGGHQRHAAPADRSRRQAAPGSSAAPRLASGLPARFSSRPSRTRPGPPRRPADVDRERQPWHATGNRSQDSRHQAGNPNLPRGSGGCCAGDPAFRPRAAAAPAPTRRTRAARSPACRHRGRSSRGTT